MQKDLLAPNDEQLVPSSLQHLVMAAAAHNTYI